MKQEEAAVAALGIFRVELFDAGLRRGQDVGVLRQDLGRGVAQIREQRKVHVPIDVAERLDLEVRDERLHLLDAVENRRDDHHRP